MVQVLPAEDQWAQAGRAAGSSAVQHYMDRTDDKALKKAISDLGESPPADKIMHAILNAKTYSNERKQEVFKNLLGVEQFRQTQREDKERSEQAKELNILKKAKYEIENKNLQLKTKQEEAQVERDKAKVEREKERPALRGKETSETIRHNIEEEKIKREKIAEDERKAVAVEKRKLEELNEKVDIAKNKYEESIRKAKAQEELAAETHKLAQEKEARLGKHGGEDLALKAKAEERKSQELNEKVKERSLAYEESVRKAKAQEELARASLEEKIRATTDKKKEKELKDEETLGKIKEVRATPGFDELDEVGQYNALTNAGVPLADAERESKIKASQINRQSTAIDKSYEAQQPFIDRTTAAARSYETETKPKLQLLTKLATDEELIGPTANAFRERLGIPLGSLDNPNNELFQKTSLDLLKGLPESYGNRILKVEVDNFLRTIPTLENSANGRRMIASNFLKLGEMKEVFYNEMQRA